MPKLSLRKLIAYFATDSNSSSLQRVLCKQELTFLRALKVCTLAISHVCYMVNCATSTVARHCDYMAALPFAA